MVNVGHARVVSARHALCALWRSEIELQRQPPLTVPHDVFHLLWSPEF